MFEKIFGKYVEMILNNDTVKDDNIIICKNFSLFSLFIIILESNITNIHIRK